jgi:hypothetical protein
MPCSYAQILANQNNALRSSGPKTPEGKAKSRANSLKHGLTGEGIVLPTEDAAELDSRFAELEDEMKPSSAMARNLVLRMALMLVKLDRSAGHEAKAIAFRMRKAEAAHVDARLAESENYYSWIASEPATNARRLRSSPEGIDLLIRAMEGLRSDLAHPDGMRWDWQHCEQLHHMMGLRRMDVPVSRARALTEAIDGNFKHLYQSDRPDLDKEKRPLWALVALVNLIDEEIAGLRELREGLDLEGIELDRAEAAHRAMFDASPEATLARKYEAANERSLYRALKEFREVQAMPPEVENHRAVATDPPGELGSCLPEPAGDEMGSCLPASGDMVESGEATGTAPLGSRAARGTDGEIQDERPGGRDARIRGLSGGPGQPAR